MADGRAPIDLDQTRIVHSSEIADDPGGFHGDYVPLEDYVARTTALTEKLASAEAEIAQWRQASTELVVIAERVFAFLESDPRATELQHELSEALIGINELAGPSPVTEKTS